MFEPVHVLPAQHACDGAPQLAHRLLAPQSWPVPHPPQLTATPQLSLTLPHLLPAQVVIMPTLVQLHTLLALHVWGDVHSAFEQQLPVFGMQVEPHCR